MFTGYRGQRNNSSNEEINMNESTKKDGTEGTKRIKKKVFKIIKRVKSFSLNNIAPFIVASAYAIETYNVTKVFSGIDFSQPGADDISFLRTALIPGTVAFLTTRSIKGNSYKILKRKKEKEINPIDKNIINISLVAGNIALATVGFFIKLRTNMPVEYLFTIVPAVITGLIQKRMAYLEEKKEEKNESKSK